MKKYATILIIGDPGCGVQVIRDIKKQVEVIETRLDLKQIPIRPVHIDITGCTPAPSAKILKEEHKKQIRKGWKRR